MNVIAFLVRRAVHALSGKLVWLRRNIVTSALVLLCTAIVSSGVVALFVMYTWDRKWDVPLPDIHASADPEVIRRGGYLVYGPAHCSECHTAPDADLEAASERDEWLPLSGGRRLAADPLGAVYAKNLTPDLETGIGRYSDPQVARMLRYSVRPNGRASIRLLMPYGNMSDADLTAIVSFLRAQAPVRNVVPPNEFTVIGKIVKSLSPVFKPRDGVHPTAEAPEEQPTRERGEYLARSVANCVGCHTKFNSVTLAPSGPDFAGGNEMAPEKRPGVDTTVWFRTPNLTPMRGSALNKFPDRETFIARFQRGGYHYAGSPMPWRPFSRMSAEDLGALYEYFHRLAPQVGPAGEAAFVKGHSPQEVLRRASR
jgi:mono/diheme cytochrome c family protein